MEFKTDPQKQCYEKVKEWMTELFGEFARFRKDYPAVGVAIGSAVAEALIFPWGQDDALICSRAYVVTGAELNQELLDFLLRQNAIMNFGAFAIDKDNDIMFDHTLPGSTATKAQVKSSLMAVVWTADKYDDEIVAKWGGQRAIDKMR